MGVHVVTARAVAIRRELDDEPQGTFLICPMLTTYRKCEQDLWRWEDEHGFSGESTNGELAQFLTENEKDIPWTLM